MLSRIWRKRPSPSYSSSWPWLTTVSVTMSYRNSISVSTNAACATGSSAASACGRRQPVDECRVAAGRFVAQAVQQLDARAPVAGTADRCAPARRSSCRRDRSGSARRARRTSSRSCCRRCSRGDRTPGARCPPRWACCGGRRSRTGRRRRGTRSRPLGVLVVGRPSDARPVDVRERLDRCRPGLGRRAVARGRRAIRARPRWPTTSSRAVWPSLKPHTSASPSTSTRRDGQVGGDVERGEQPLPAGGLDLPELLRAIAQPDRVQVG